MLCRKDGSNGFLPPWCRYGALMWALGKCVATPEVLRVYIGSFWNEPYREGVWAWPGLAM
jgi:hypothetical protein